MPYSCMVPNCRGNYKNGPKVTVFKFPSNEEEKQKWIAAIPRQDYTLTNGSRVCEVHFKVADLIREQHYQKSNGETASCDMQRVRLRKGAIPSVFPGCPSYLSKQDAIREKPEDKRIRLQNEQLNTAIKESLKVKEAEDKRFLFSNYSEFLKCLENESIPSFWDVIKKESTAIFLCIGEEVAPHIKCSVVIDENLKVSAFIGTSAVISYLNNDTFPMEIRDFREFIKILDFMESTTNGKPSNFGNQVANAAQEILENLKEYFPENESLLSFLVNQISLLSSEKHVRRYTPETLILSALLSSISPHGYKFLRSSGFILPHPTTIRKFSSSFNASPYLEQFDDNFLDYAKEKISSLESHEKIVTLMVDEIYIKEYFDYKAGNLVGMAFDCQLAATSAHVFMVQSMLSSYKDVVHILPVKSICADNLHKVIKRIILGLEEIGFFVICVVTDNNSINRKAISYFLNPPQVSIVYPHPCQSDRPLFFVIDTVHILKCIRNNWLNQRNPDTCMYYPDFYNHGNTEMKSASFNTLKKLHDVEKGNIVSFNKTLTYKALNPTSLERQNVKLVLRIFNEFVLQALIEVGDRYKLNLYKDTAEFIRLILQWWYVVNVKHPKKGIHKRCTFMQPLTLSDEDERVKYLTSFLDWLDAWKSQGCKTGTLTKETHLALSHSTHALLEMSQYCMRELNFKYFLCGKVQTDALEERFGKYRRLAGCQYNVSLRQVFECESKLRLQSSLPLSVNSNKFGTIPIKNFNISNLMEELGNINESINLTIKPSELLDDENILPVLTFLAGYCVYSICKHFKCEFCLSELSVNKALICDDEMYSLISNLDRGALKFPVPEIVVIVHYCFLIVKKLLSADYEDVFLKKMNQRLLVVTIAFHHVRELEFYSDFTSCSEHSTEDVVKKTLWASCNIFLKNYITRRNDSRQMEKNVRKRKLTTFNK